MSLTYLNDTLPVLKVSLIPHSKSYKGSLLNKISVYDTTLKYPERKISFKEDIKTDQQSEELNFNYFCI